MSLALHIFRRDLRLQDNTPLLYALDHAKQVLPCFIFDPRQVKDNPYKSNAAITFMLESLEDLAKQLQQQQGRLYLFYGEAEDIVAQLSEKLPIELITFHRDYTPFAQQRDEKILQIAQQKGIPCHSSPDVLLNEPESIFKKDQTPYTIFTPFFKRAIGQRVAEPRPNTATRYYTQSLPQDQGLPFLKTLRPDSPLSPPIKGGSQAAQDLLKKAVTLTAYHRLRDYPFSQEVSFLSAHHKFGTLSIRQTYHTLYREHPYPEALIRQLYWRDFFTHIAHHFPHVWEKPFHEHLAHIPWSHNTAHFERWTTGTTGFPFVDAGMRELNTTGYMHNRLRMITASFLVKDLHIDWRWGEKYFAQKLIDYDPAVNNGNWQWAASTGCDAQPYFRVFNPWRQQQRFDPKGIYIKKWIPQLQHLDPKALHQIPQVPLPANTYPSPMVDHATAAQKAKQLYRNLPTVPPLPSS